MNISKKDIFGNPIAETDEDQKKKYQAMSEKLANFAQLPEGEQDKLIKDLAFVVASNL